MTYKTTLLPNGNKLNKREMKTLIILAVCAMSPSGYKYACADENNKAFRMMMAEEFQVGDTVTVDSLFYVVSVRPHK